MDLNKYQEESRIYARYPSTGNNVVYTALALCGESGESGEYAENIKKAIRDEGYKMGDSVLTISPERRQKAKDELGDVLWYVANNATELGITLEEVADHNLAKLKDRKINGKKLGSG